MNADAMMIIALGIYANAIIVSKKSVHRKIAVIIVLD